MPSRVPAAASRLPLPASTLPPWSRFFATQTVQGRVVSISGPDLHPPCLNGWKWLVVLLALPLLAGAAIALLAVRALTTAFLPRAMSGAAGRSLIDEMASYLVLKRLFDRPDPVPVRSYLLDTAAGRVEARQEGQFRDGNVLTGQEIAFRGHFARGVFRIREGRNITTGALLTLPGNPWKTLVLAGCALIAVLSVIAALQACAAGRA